jgi:hypothetical protein
MNEEINMEIFGIVNDSEKVAVNGDVHNHRLFIMENGIACAKIEDSGKKDEQYSSFLFYWSRQDGDGKMRKFSIETVKKHDKQIKLFVGEKKFKITFDKVCTKNRILQWCQKCGALNQI